jgi:hypothetical protein
VVEAGNEGDRVIYGLLGLVIVGFGACYIELRHQSALLAQLVRAEGQAPKMRRALAEFVTAGVAEKPSTKAVRYGSRAIG